MVKEELIFSLSMIEQEIGKLQEQLQMIEQQTIELQSLEESLKEIEKTQEKSMLANLGKNIFIKTEIQEKKLYVDIGKETFVKKNIPDTIKIIEKQIKKLLEAKDKILMRMQETQARAEDIIRQAQEENEEEKK